MKASLVLAVAMVVCLGGASLSAQASWQMHGGDMQAIVVGESAADLLPGERLERPAGVASVHFPSDALGKPASLKIATEDGDDVVVAVATAAPALARKLRFGEAAHEGTLSVPANAAPIHVLTVGDVHADDGNYRVSVTVASGTGDRVIGGGMFGLVVRHRANEGCYMFSVDWPTATLRLMRWMGSDHVVVKQVAAPVDLTLAHTLTLQAQGFRLQAFVDDALVLQVFDGALREGSVGVAWRGERPEFGDLTLEPTAAPRASAVLVQAAGRARLSAAVAVPPGNLHVLELLLDRPHGLLPRTASGLEPWLLQRPASPTILFADWRNSLGNNGIGEVPVGGVIVSELRWPALPGLRHRVALLRSVLVTADGDAITGVTPSVRVVF